jgi:hypothetical protein
MRMAKKRKLQKMTPEEIPERERTQQMLRERLAYREAKEREHDERERKASGSP